MRLSIRDRFFSHVNEDGPVIRGGAPCWVWTGALNEDGYGRFWTSGGTIRASHRASWELHNGPVPTGLCVLHRCDNRSCVRPDHLYLGTQADNLMDMRGKGRVVQVRGSENPASKLNEADVLEIKRLLSAGELQKNIAARFGVARSTIKEINTGRTWSHVK